jgi:hypothetical protein
MNVTMACQPIEFTLGKTGVYYDDVEYFIIELWWLGATEVPRLASELWQTTA